MTRRLWWLPMMLLVAALVASTTMAGCGSSGNHATADAGGGGSDGSSSGGGSDANLFGETSGQQLVVAPAAPTLPVTGPGTTLQFSAHFAGDTTPLTASWTIDVPTIGSIDG